ncbi:high-affinity branched-chain amino acid ABC transporter ATP-binding protein LivG [Serratia marcescens]|uniref:high-affinity branched-chain amino acid ABC transporter ATP-binding protein LivG n=1 Tax=Serratia marcescens TaxID=615 RepID=UPI000F7D8205|nr:high-affinity branched-chain amino acid ABC transporter ATP-binding protein LivG [Serratia marcescens]RTG00653.1 high-affinity branched-chain amino acid ABC transporter ATP-binding protein LivG [Serratia marcescens]
MLSFNQVSAHYGKIQALHQVSLTISQGEIVTLIGANGAGKTTVFNCLTGFYRPSGGTIKLRDRHLEGLAGQAIARMGVVRTFQHVRLFREMTVIENLLVAQHMQSNRNLIAGVLNTPGYRRAESAALDHAFYWLEVVDLVSCANRLAGEMSYGQQRRLEIARAMCTAPEMICLDEPAAGLNPVETATLSRIIRFLRQHHGITVLLIEHDMGMVMEISDRVIVLDHGDVIARGTPQEIQHNEAVIAAYLGADEEELAG